MVIILQTEKNIENNPFIEHSSKELYSLFANIFNS